MVIGSFPVCPTDGSGCKSVSVPYEWLLRYGVVLCLCWCFRYIWRVNVGPLGGAVLDPGLEFFIAGIGEAVKEDPIQCLAADLGDEGIQFGFACIQFG